MSGADGDDTRSAKGFAPRDLSGALTQRMTETGAALDRGAVFAQRFRIEDRVGSGSFADVYRANDLKSGREVALKLIRSDRLVTDAKRQEFIREGVRTQELNSKSIVRVFDISDHEGQPYIVMEWLGALTLRRWMNQRLDARAPASIATSCNVILAILDGLDEAHQRGIVHRDLKPENVILLAEPNDTAAPLRVVDFGISASVRELSQAQTTGTQDYMPSEQGRGAAPHATADIYALSVMFYEMLIGGVPRHNTSPAASRPDVPAGVDRLVSRGLADFAGTRPQTVAAYRTELQAAMTAAAAEAEKAHADAVDQKRKEDALAEQARLKKEKEEAAARARADRDAEAARRREAAAVAASAPETAETPAPDPVKADPVKPRKDKDNPLGATLVTILVVAANIGFVIGALLVAARAWTFVTHDFKPTRDFACSVGLKSSCPGTPLVITDEMRAKLVPKSGITTGIPASEIERLMKPKPSASPSPSISDLLIAPTTPTTTQTLDPSVWKMQPTPSAKPSGQR